MHVIISWRFPIRYFFSIALSESMRIFHFNPSSSPSNSFSMLLFHSVFLLCSLRSHILLPNCFLSLSSGCILPELTQWIFFSLFWNISFCLHCFTLSRYLLTHLSFTSTSGLFPQIVFSGLLVLLLLFVPTCFSDLPLSYHFCLLA